MIAVERLGKRYRLHHQHARQSYVALRDVIADAVRRPLGWLSSAVSPDEVEEFWALKDVSFEVRQGEVAGHHRPQRRRQKHAAQDPEPDHRADRRTRHHARPRRQPARSRHRLSSGADRPGEHFSERRDPGHDRARRSRASSTRSSRLRGSSDSSTRRSNATRAACMCGWRLRWPLTSNPKS